MERRGQADLARYDLVVEAGRACTRDRPERLGKEHAGARSGRGGLRGHRGTGSYDGQDLLAMPAEARGREGVFLAFQYPVEIPV
jgi:Fe-S cluster assembly ATP-binding protein